MAEANSLLEKLDGLTARFEEISTLITDPSVIADQRRYVKLSKEYKDLERLVAARDEDKKLLQNAWNHCSSKGFGHCPSPCSHRRTRKTATRRQAEELTWTF